MKLLPARPGGGELCGQIEAHAAHGACPGLRPENWVPRECIVCHELVWMPPETTIDGVPVLAVCSTLCGLRAARLVPLE